MRLLPMLFSLLALPLAGEATAAQLRLPDVRSALAEPLFFRMPGAQAPDEAPLHLAQAGDPRIVGLEEQVRQLTGRIEEMNFQMLQMQEQLRKMQEDVDFRLQAIEQKRGDAGPAAGTEPRPRADAPQPPRDQQVAEAPTMPPGAQAGPGEPPRTLGTMVFDEQGNLIDGTIDPNATAEGGEPMHPDSGTVVAALPSSADPEQLYRSSYDFILSGDYGTAEAGFREYIERFPQDARAADAHYWLGESLLGQQRYRDAAELFVDANRRFPDSRKSPDMLFKLGVSLAALNQRDVACATFAKVGQRYPQASDALKQRVKQEQALSGC